MSDFLQLLVAGLATGGIYALVAIGFMAAATAFGCGGLSDAATTTRCTQEQASKTACFDPNVLAMCESCFERCGDSCISAPVPSDKVTSPSTASVTRD